MYILATAKHTSFDIQVSEEVYGKLLLISLACKWKDAEGRKGVY